MVFARDVLFNDKEHDTCVRICVKPSNSVNLNKNVVNEDSESHTDLEDNEVEPMDVSGDAVDEIIVENDNPSHGRTKSYKKKLKRELIYLCLHTICVTNLI